MKKRITIIIPFILGCFMIVNTGYHKAAGLRDGVYECAFTEIVPDSIRDFWAPDTLDVRWTLTVMDGEAFFHMNKKWPGNGYWSISNHGEYFLRPEEQPDGTMTAKVIIREEDEVERGGLARDIKLIFKNIDPNSVDVEIVEGTIWKKISASGVYHLVIPLSPETQTLTFVRELSDEDQTWLLHVKSTLEMDDDHQ